MEKIMREWLLYVFLSDVTRYKNAGVFVTISSNVVVLIFYNMFIAPIQSPCAA